MASWNSGYNRLHDGVDSTPKNHHSHSAALAPDLRISDWNHELDDEPSEQPGAASIGSYSRVTSPKPLRRERTVSRPWQLWQPSLMMVALIVLGTAVASAHHMAYRYLD